MPHKRNPVLSENLSGLSRLLRAYALAALENVALWHERDISHSSVERVIGPDATILLDFMLDRFTGMIDRLVVLHALEVSDQPDALLEECLRVLGPGGRALLIVPNRAGLWAPRETTPFGFGRPYTLGQLEAQARRAGFAPERSAAALYIPPSQRRFWLRSAPMWERLGARAAGFLAAGVLMLEVSKQIHSPRRPGLGAAVRKPLSILEGAQKPVAGPV